MEMEFKYCRETRVIQTRRVFPNDTNNYQTLFGGTLMANIDDVASISAARHCRTECVTASTDSVDFLHPIKQTDAICLESFVVYTGNSSMEVFVKVVAEDLLTGAKQIAATAFLTFVAMDPNGNKVKVPDIKPETEEEHKLYETAVLRANSRKERKERSKELAKYLTIHSTEL